MTKHNPPPTPEGNDQLASAGENPERGYSDPLSTETRGARRSLLATDVALMAFVWGPNLRLPHSRAFGEGLFELRPRGRSGIVRALYCFLISRRAVVLHAFVKKSQQTPDRERKLARKGMKEMLLG